MAVAYQPNPYELDKLLWLENFEILFSELTTMWDGVTIKTGDINIIILENKKNLQNVTKTSSFI